MLEIGLVQSLGL